MNIPIQIFIFLAIITLYYTHKYRKGQNFKATSAFIGLSFSSIKYYALGIFISIISVIMAWFIFKYLPIDNKAFQSTIFNGTQIETLSFKFIFILFIKQLIFTAFGEEILFRGLIGGILFKKYFYVKANILQSIIFIIPHTLLLLISFSFLPFILLQLVSGWLLGWLRYKSQSILPSTISHSITNTFSILLFYFILN